MSSHHSIQEVLNPIETYHPIFLLKILNFQLNVVLKCNASYSSAILHHTVLFYCIAYLSEDSLCILISADLHLFYHFTLTPSFLPPFIPSYLPSSRPPSLLLSLLSSSFPPSYLPSSFLPLLPLPPYLPSSPPPFFLPSLSPPSSSPTYH